MIREVRELHKLFKHRGVIAENCGEGLVREKLPDGRCILSVNAKIQPRMIVSPHVKTGQLLTITLEGNISAVSPASNWHFGPYTWNRIPDLQTVTTIGQFNKRLTGPFVGAVWAGNNFENGGFVADHYVALWHIDLGASPPEYGRLKVLMDAEDAVDVHLDHQKDSSAFQTGPIDLSSGFYDQSFTDSLNGITYRTIITLTWDR